MDRSKIQLFLTSLLACFVAGTPAFAQAPVDEAGRGTWSFTIENDIIAGTDRDYTNGALVSYVGPSNNLPLVGRIVRDNLDWLTTAKKWHMAYGVGQNMYTPQDITTTTPDPADRPYAGFLYGSIGIAADRRDSDGELRQLDVLALDVGIVGKGSLAEQAQKFVHKAIDD
jgi:lipid A 3-O-deacylase